MEKSRSYKQNAVRLLVAAIAFITLQNEILAEQEKSSDRPTPASLIQKHLARPNSFQIEKEMAAVDMGDYTYTNIHFIAENESGAIEKLAASVHTSKDGKSVELIEIRNRNTGAFVFEAGTEGVKAEVVSVQAQTWVSPDGEQCIMIYLEWKNVGDKPIHELKAEIRAKDAQGRYIESVSVKSFNAYTTSDGQGVLPGATYRKPKGDGWILGEIGDLKRVGFENVDVRIVQAYGKRGMGY